jgi:hypothetical protein
VKSKESTEFDATKNFLFCYHPHGVASFGALTMATAASGFDEMFPGLKASLQTLSINFWLPVTRENIIGLGIGDASRSSIHRALTLHPGSSAILVTGGAAESMLSHPHTSNVVMKTRFGFVAAAMRAGANLVPVWAFGENNVYENLAHGNPGILRWQRRIQKFLTFAPLLVAGRGVFSYSGGLIPHRRPITVVVGDPISVGPADPNPSREKIQEIHAEYMEAVQTLFEKYKDIYDPKAKPITFV